MITYLSIAVFVDVLLVLQISDAMDSPLQSEHAVLVTGANPHVSGVGGAVINSEQLASHLQPSPPCLSARMHLLSSGDPGRPLMSSNALEWCVCMYVCMYVLYVHVCIVCMCAYVHNMYVCSMLTLKKVSESCNMWSEANFRTLYHKDHIFDQ